MEMKYSVRIFCQGIEAWKNLVEELVSETYFNLESIEMNDIRLRLQHTRNDESPPLWCRLPELFKLARLSILP